VTRPLDAVVVGSGPNGLAAAIVLAERGLAVHVVEAADEVGGACRSAELTLPGFLHDVGASVMPFATSSRFFREFPADRYGLEVVHPAVPMAHPFDGEDAVLLERSITATAAGLGGDAGRYRRLLSAATRHEEQILDQFLGPLRPPRHPLLVAAFGAPDLQDHVAAGIGVAGDEEETELVLEPGAEPPAPAPFVLHTVSTGQRILATVPATAAAEAVGWADGLKRAGQVEEFALAPATLEDVYVELVGRADALQNGNGTQGAASIEGAATTAGIAEEASHVDAA